MILSYLDTRGSSSGELERGENLEHSVQLEGADCAQILHLVTRSYGKMPSKSRSPLPGDVVFEVLKWCQYSSVISIRLLSKACYDMTTTRLIWVLLVRNHIEEDTQTRIRYIVERPISTHATSELEALIKRWAKAEYVWLNPHNRSPLGPSLQFKLNTPSFGNHRDISTSFLVPGGRWFIEFGVDASALYYDLDSDAPKPFVLISPSTGRFVQDLTVFKPYIISSTERLIFYTGVCFLDGQHDRWITTLWRIDVSLDPTSTSPYILRAEQARSFVFEHPPHASLYMEAMDLSNDYICYYSSESPRAGRYERPCRAVTVVKWPEVLNGTENFERRTLYVDRNFTNANILPQECLLVHSRTKTLLLQYRNSPIYTRTPTINEIISAVNLHAAKDLRPHGYQYRMTVDNESIISSPFITMLRDNQTTYTTFHQTVLIGLNDDERIPCLMELRFRDGAPSTEEPHVTVSEMMPTTIGSCMNSRKFFTPPHGYRSGLLEFDGEGMKFNMYLIKEDDNSLEIRGSVNLGSQRRRVQGTIHSIDEGTGRVLMYDNYASLVSVFDLVDRE